MGLYDPFNVLSILRYPAKQKFYIPFKNTGALRVVLVIVSV